MTEIESQRHAGYDALKIQYTAYSLLHVIFLKERIVLSIALSCHEFGDQWIALPVIPICFKMLTLSQVFLLNTRIHNFPTFYISLL